MKWFVTACLAIVLALPARAEIKIDEVTSPGGIKAWLVQEPAIPFVSIELRFQGGGSLDAPGKRGAVNLMTALLNEGAADRDARSYVAAIEGLAAQFDFETYDDSVAISAKFLNENRDEAVALLRDALVSPRFDTDAVERVRRQVLSVIDSDAKDPNEISGAAFNDLAFNSHPYETSRDGTSESVSALTVEDLQAAHLGALARDRVFVGAAGDITPDELGALLDMLLGELPETGAPLPQTAEVVLPGGVHVVPFDTPQSVATFGHEGLKREDPDFFAAYVMNTILGGGGFEARLMQEVREKRGLTYGVYSYLVTKDHAELYLGRVASANDRIAEAIAVVQDEWRKMAEEGVTEAELNRAKTYLTGAYPLRFDSNAAIAGILVGMQTIGLTPDYIVTRNDRVDAVTSEDVARVAKRLMDTEGLTFVVVGQPEGLPSQ